MKKTLTGLVALLFIGISIANAQSTKKVPPPPPPPKNVDIIEKVLPPPPPPEADLNVPAPPTITITITSKQAEEFYKRNPTVIDISRQGDLITLKMKDGAVEKYNMSNKGEKKNFTDKYGAQPIPPLPPAPPKPKKIS